MKPKVLTILIAVSSIFICRSLPAQTLSFAKDAAILTPEGKLVAIPQTPGNLSATFTVTTDGLNAPVRTKSGDVRIVVKAENAGDSPYSAIKAFKMNVKRESRRASMGAYGIKSKDIIQFQAEKYGDDCFLLTFKNLAPGEYGLWYGGTMEFNSLGLHSMIFWGVDE